jgi:hypothetical protein
VSRKRSQSGGTEADRSTNCGRLVRVTGHHQQRNGCRKGAARVHFRRQKVRCDGPQGSSCRQKELASPDKCVRVVLPLNVAG